MTAFADAGDNIRSLLKLTKSFLINPVARASHRKTNQIHNAACDRFRIPFFRSNQSLKFETLLGLGVSRRGLLDCSERSKVGELTPLADQRSIAVLSMGMHATDADLVFASLKF